jgi:hypothetical protein
MPTLSEAILNGGLKSVNFFNGRLLSAEDLRQEQQTRTDLDRRLGRSIGDGVAFGLEVSEAPGASRSQPVLRITPGLAVNRRGRSLELPEVTNISLMRPPREINAANASTTGFSDCQPLEDPGFSPNANVYLLVLSPAKGNDGRAQVNGFDGNSGANCNVKYNLEGVQFRLIPIELPASDLADPARLRNRLAYRCFGQDDANLDGFLTNPFGPSPSGYGLLDSIRTQRLTDCDVPLAVLHWTAENGLRFVDMWAVRRRINDPTISRWDAMLGDRTQTEAEARLHQFEDQVQEFFLTNPIVSDARASNLMAFLPPAGIIPIASSTQPLGFRPEIFFYGLRFRPPVWLEDNKLSTLLKNSMTYPAISLGQNSFVWLYYIAPNIRANPSTQAYLAFASGAMPWVGETRFDINRFDRANFV